MYPEMSYHGNEIRENDKERLSLKTFLYKPKSQNIIILWKYILNILQFSNSQWNNI